MANSYKITAETENDFSLVKSKVDALPECIVKRIKSAAYDYFTIFIELRAYVTVGGETMIDIPSGFNCMTIQSLSGNMYQLTFSYEGMYINVQVPNDKEQVQINQLTFPKK